MKYLSELMRVTNTKTGKTHFYVKKCDVFSRISRAEYDHRYNEADDFSCICSATTGTKTRHYITVIYHQ